MSEDPTAEIARATATHLTGEYGPALPHHVEAALHQRDDTPPVQYGDPVAIASLIVAVATLAWAIYADLRARNPNPPPDVLTRTIRIRLHDTGQPQTPHHDRIIDAVVAETIHYDGN